MTIENFEKLVNEGIKAIPERFLRKLKNVDIVVEEEPAPKQLRELKIRKNAFLFGLYEGVPQTERWGYGQVLPDKITIFKNPIENAARSHELPKEAKGLRRDLSLRIEEEIKTIVKNTVWHEIAHHFGMDEKKVRQAESRRIKARL